MFRILNKSYLTLTIKSGSRATFLLILLAVSALCAPRSASAEGDWAVTFYGGKLTPDSLGKTLSFSADYVDSYVYVLAVSKKLLGYKNFAELEIEGQVAKHFGEQDNWETNGLLTVRWLLLPWDKYLDTDFAAGAGLSYALSTPSVEELGTPDTPKLLGYLMFEVAVSPRWTPNWSLLARIHHRSGAGGLFDGRRDASNALCFGIRHSF